MLQFANPIAAGTVLVRPALQSPNFAVGSSGWIVRADGTFEFNGGVFRGGVNIGGATYIYSGLPTAGNLVESLGVPPGAGLTDPEGNAVLSGDTTYSYTIGHTQVLALRKTGGDIEAWVATTQAGPYARVSTITFDTGGNIAVPGTFEVAQSKAFIPPSGDGTGATDPAEINSFLGSGYEVTLAPGTYYAAAGTPVQHGAHAILRGAGRDSISSPFVTTIKAVGNLPAVIASSSWVNSTGAGQNGGQIRDLQVDCNNMAGGQAGGICLQTEDALIDNVQVLNSLGHGIVFAVLCADGLTVVSGDLSNNKVSNCAANNIVGRGIAAIEHAGSDVFTDGYALFNVIADSGTGIGLDQAADWQIIGNHVYNLQNHGFLLGDCFNTHVFFNEIDQWGQSALAGTYRGIDAVTVPSTGGMSDISHNVVWMGPPPGNAGTAIEGINLGCAALETCCYTAVGNNAWMQTAAGFSSAIPFIANNAAASSVMNLQTTGNFAFGHWATPNWILNLTGGTINHTTGV